MCGQNDRTLFLQNVPLQFSPVLSSRQKCNDAISYSYQIQIFSELVNFKKAVSEKVDAERFVAMVVRTDQSRADLS